MTATLALPPQVWYVTRMIFKTNEMHWLKFFSFLILIEQGITTITDQSCNDLKSCSHTSGEHIHTALDTFWIHCGMILWLIIIALALHFVTGFTTISAQSCNGPYSCSLTSGKSIILTDFCRNSIALIADPLSILNRTGTTEIVGGSCNKARACSNATGEIFLLLCFFVCYLLPLNINANTLDILGTYAFIGPNSCNGEEACEGITSANMTVVNSCNMKEACKSASGKSNSLQHSLIHYFTP